LSSRLMGLKSGFSLA